MQRVQDCVLVVAVCCALLALVVSAPVSLNNNNDANKEEVKASSKTSPEEELKQLPLKPSSDAAPKSSISQETAEKPTTAEESEIADDAEKRSDDSYLPMDADSLLAQEQQQQQQQQQQQPELPGLPAGDFFSLDDTQYGQAAPLPALDLSPKTVAEYLLLTGDWQSFEQATADLLAAGILTPTEVGEYRDDVAYEYESLMRQVAETEAAYLEETDPYEGYDLPLDSVPQMDPNMAAGPLSMDEMDMPYFDLTDELRRLELEELLEKEAALDDLLQAIVEEYAERAQEEDLQNEAMQNQVMQNQVMQNQVMQNGAMQNEFPNAHVVEVLDLGVDAYEGQISTDDDKMPSQDKIIDELSEVKDIAESSKEVEDELESLGQQQLPQTAESMNEIVPVQAEEKLETVDAPIKNTEEIRA